MAATPCGRYRVATSFLLPSVLVSSLLVLLCVRASSDRMMMMHVGRRSAFATGSRTAFRRHGRPAATVSSSSFPLYNNNNNNNNNGADSSSVPTTATQSLVRSRLSIQEGKRDARRGHLADDRRRNLRLKRLLHDDATNNHTNSSYVVPEMYSVKVSVDRQLREELRLNGREKRGRVFLERSTDNNGTTTANRGDTTLQGLRQELHSFFRCLKKSTFILHAALPEVSADGSVVSPSSDTPEFLTRYAFWPVDSDEAVLDTFARAYTHYNNTASLLKRPSLLLHVSKDPNAPLPPPPPGYLDGMADPASSDTMTMLSFYAFPTPSILDPEEFGDALRKLWRPFDALGRVYVAEEGVNAQMAVPSNVMSNFMECCKSVPELGEFMENGINIDPIPLTMEEFRTAGNPINEDDPPSPPFKALHVRVRAQVVSDGLTTPLDWQQAGYDMPPEEWHNTIKSAKDNTGKDDKGPLIFDCRNEYETGVGRFDLAEPLNTETFRDTWGELEDRLKDTPKDAPIMTYCTGGIRCVKVGAYLTQRLNFTNVSRLAGGIIAYDRTISNTTESKLEGETSLFKGTNYVFDGRVGRPVTDDALGDCTTCGAKTSLLNNCRNGSCHKRIVQCEKCRTKFLGSCSDACKQRVITAQLNANKGMIPLRTSEADANVGKSNNRQARQHRSGVQEDRLETVEEYADYYSSASPPLLQEIQENTAHFFPTGKHMVSGSSQGQLLTTLASLTRNGRILEIGTFSGYATACLWKGIKNKDDGSLVLSLERDIRAVELAAKHLSILEKNDVGKDAADLARLLRSANSDSFNDNTIKIEEGQPITFSTNNSNCHLVHVTDALATMDQMVSKSGPFHPMAPFDLIFVDADKTRLLEYVEASLSLLSADGLIVVDNVLWKGLVLEAAGGESKNKDEEGNQWEDVVNSNTEADLKRSRRARRLAGIMHRFNEAISKDDRLEVIMLPIRDGLSLIRKK